MEAFKPFNEEYIDDPLRRAEHRVHEELLNCDRHGLFIHEWKFDQQFAEVDFVVWIEGVALFAIQVKGGTYRYVLREAGGEWQLWKNGRMGQSHISLPAGLERGEGPDGRSAPTPWVPHLRAARPALSRHGGPRSMLRV